jgi:hypothetical protein
MNSNSRFWGALSLGVLAVGIWPGPQLAREIRSAPEPEPKPSHQVSVTPSPSVPPAPQDSLEPWIDRIRPFCNVEDVDLFTDLRPPPGTEQGVAYEAACFALAGRIPKARALILGLPVERRVQAVGTVYDVATSTFAADLDPAVGPIMELVLEFWPNHYLALYYAGRTRFATGDLQGAAVLLSRFLDLYPRDDHLTANARRMLASTRGS